MFQKKIVEKYLAKIDRHLLEEKYKLYSSIFLKEAKQKNIRESKEDQYQEGFIRDLFVAVLGYTIKPEENYNILTELKNEVANKSNSKKSDGAICEENNENKIRAVIELKGCDTTDLDKVAFQAFSYKNHHENCNYVIVSNFERLRVYVETQIEFVEFNLFRLNKNEFDLLYLLLEINQLKSDVPLKLKHETVSEEKQITDNFYADYSTFKRLLFEDLVENNPDTDKLLLFKKTQKLLDRILFILFCEDRNLLPPNSVAGIIKNYQDLKKMGFGQPLYEVFKNFFNRVNSGYVDESDESKNVFAYNGGLFKADDVLDSIKVGDDVLFVHSRRLADYDFESQISVDILGRIFENSLTEIEEVQKELGGESLPLAPDGKPSFATPSNGENPVTPPAAKSIGKRKKDGVFYTPEYITKYIVENTIGKLCSEKKEELKIVDEDFSAQKNYKAAEAKEFEARLKNYRAWLLDLKICDPACGSGAFLNAALHELRKEHYLIDRLWQNIFPLELNFEVTDNTILENNLYGVDINEDSVEITKLSLWLHTAKKNRKLSTLNDKIKCGNSLIDNSQLAIDNAFNWEKEFPEVFANGGGFDVVIGNPPYVNFNNIKNEAEKDYYRTNYKTVLDKSDLYSVFTEKAHYLLKPNGLLGFIFSNSWMGIKSFSAFREFLAKDVKVTQLVELPEKVFADATVKTCICFYTNTKPNENDIIKINKCDNQRFFSKGFDLEYKQILSSPIFSFSFEKNIELNKVKTVLLKNIASFTQGIKTANDKKFILQKKENEDCYLILRGRDIKKWSDTNNAANEYIWYRPDLMSENVNARPRRKENFLVDNKILIQDIAQEINATLDKNQHFCNDTINVIYDIDKNYDLKFILALLNSKLVNFWFKRVFPSGLHIKTNQLEQIPIPIPSTENNPQIAQINTDENICGRTCSPNLCSSVDKNSSNYSSALAELAEKMLSLNESLQKKTQNFLKVVKQTFGLEKVSLKLENFYELDFDGFIKELKTKVSPKTKMEWLEVFEETQKELLGLKAQIEATDGQINSLVYELYGLSAEEIAVIENCEL